MKRTYSNAEKWLLAAPLVFVMIAGGVWGWRRTMPISIEVDSSEVKAFRFSPDSKRLAVITEDFKLKNNTGWVYDLESRVPTTELATLSWTKQLRHAGQIPRFGWPAWSPDGTRLVAPYDDGSQGSTGRHQVGKFVVWDADSGVMRGSYFFAPPYETSYGGGLRYSRDGKTIIASQDPPSVFDAETGARLRILNGTFKRATEGYISKTTDLLALQGDRYRGFQVYDQDAKRVVWSTNINKPGHFFWGGDVLGVIQTPDTKAAVYGYRLLLWDGKTRQSLPSSPVATASYIDGFNFGPGEKTVSYVITKYGSSKSPREESSELVAWDYGLKRVKWRYSYPGRLVWYRAQSSNDGKWLAIIQQGNATSPAAVLVFDQGGNVCLKHRVSSDLLAFSPDSTQLAIVGMSDRTNGKSRIKIFRTRNWEK